MSVDAYRTSSHLIRRPRAQEAVPAAYMEEAFGRFGSITGNRVHVDSAMATNRRRFAFVIGENCLERVHTELAPVRLQECPQPPSVDRNRAVNWFHRAQIERSDSGWREQCGRDGCL